MASPQQQVDGYLGEGWYAEWKKIDRQTDQEQRRFRANKGRLDFSVTSPLFDRIRGDQDILKASRSITTVGWI